MAKNRRKFDNFYVTSKIALLKKYPNFYHLLSKLNHIKNTILVLFFLPLLIFEILIFILKNYKKLKRNNKISIFFHWSFGHQILAVDYLSRINSKEKITLVTLQYPRNNPYLYSCYENIENLNFESRFIKNKYKIHGDAQSIALEFFIKLFFYNKILIDWKKLYIVEKTNLKFYCTINKKLVTYTTDTREYPKLIDDIKIKVKMPKSLTDLVEREINNKFPKFFEKPFVTFLLRSRRSLEQYDNARDSGLQMKYLKTIKKFVKNGFNVVGSGETDDDLFKNIEGYYDLSELNLDKYIISLYVLFKTQKLICQHSGPLILTNILKIQNIVINSFPFFLGTYNKDDKILFVKVKYKNKYISTKKIYDEIIHENLRFGDLSNKDYELEECTENEIFSAVFNEDYYDLKLSKDMLIYHTGNYKFCKHEESWLRE